MKRSKKFYKDKKLRSTMVEYYKQRKGRYRDEYSLIRDGWNIQYVLSKDIKKNPIGEYLQQILYLILDQKWVKTLDDDLLPEYHHISKDIFEKLTTGQKMCFVESSHLEAKLNSSNQFYVPTKVSDYQLDPELKEHIIPVVFKHYRKNYLYQHTELDEKVKRDNLYPKSIKVMGEKRDWLYYTETVRRLRESNRKKQMREEVKEFQ